MYSLSRKPCRIKYQYTEEGERVRVSRRSGRVIPKPIELLERKDFKSRSGYVGKSKLVVIKTSSACVSTWSFVMRCNCCLELQNTPC